MISLSEAIDIIRSNTHVLETVNADLGAVYNSVLAEDVKSDMDMPPFNKSAMDGFAVKASISRSLPVILQASLTVAAGETPGSGSVSSGKKSVAESECVRIMTGAPLPEGLERLIRDLGGEVPGGRSSPIRP